jgi:hypothetical protein
VIRLRFSAEDLARIRISSALGPFAETTAAAELICGRPPGAIFGGWRRSLKGQLDDRVRPLVSIFSPDRPGLDFCTLVGPVDTIGEGIDRLMSARPVQLRAEIDGISLHHPSTAWPWMRLDTDTGLRRQLSTAIRSFHAVAVGPRWPQLRQFLQAERASQIELLATAGIDRFLSMLCPPLIQWQPPLLLIQSLTGSSLNVDLAGRGLVIRPSVFLTPRPVLSRNPYSPDASPTLIYPALRELSVAHPLWAPARDRQALAGLLGRTRSAALEAIAEGCGTGELALRIGVSAPAASQHATALRRAGLITTHRSAGMVRHTLTPLGLSLLNGAA